MSRPLGSDVNQYPPKENRVRRWMVVMVARIVREEEGQFTVELVREDVARNFSEKLEDLPVLLEQKYESE